MVSTDVVRDLDRNAVVVGLAGEFTTANRRPVGEVVRKCLAECPLAVVVDFTRVVLLDPRALTVLLALHYAAMEEPAVALLLVCPAGKHRGVLERSATTRNLPTYETVTDALAAVAITWSGQRVHLLLEADPTAGQRARRVIDVTCLAWALPHLLNRARLVVSELVYNAVEHAGGIIEVSLMLRGHFLYIGVRDTSPVAPRIVEPWHPLAGRGRGLRLVASQSSSWGSMATPTGKLVWATLDLWRRI